MVHKIKVTWPIILVLGAFFLGGCATTMNDVSRYEQERNVEKLIGVLESDYVQIPEVRSKAAEALGNIGDKQARAPLSVALADTDCHVRIKAAEALAKMGDIQPLIAALEDPHFYVRTQAAEALGKIGSKTAIDPLAATLNDPELWARYAAAKALDELGWRPRNETEKAMLDSATQSWSAAGEVLKNGWRIKAISASRLGLLKAKIYDPYINSYREKHVEPQGVFLVVAIEAQQIEGDIPLRIALNRTYVIDNEGRYYGIQGMLKQIPGKVVLDAEDVFDEVEARVLVGTTGETFYRTPSHKIMIPFDIAKDSKKFKLLLSDDFPDIYLPYDPLLYFPYVGRGN